MKFLFVYALRCYDCMIWIIQILFRFITICKFWENRIKKMFFSVRSCFYLYKWVHLFYILIYMCKYNYHLCHNNQHTCCNYVFPFNIHLYLFKIFGFNTWNHLPSHIFMSKSLVLFKQKLNRYNIANIIISKLCFFSLSYIINIPCNCSLLYALSDIEIPCVTSFTFYIFG